MILLNFQSNFSQPPHPTRTNHTTDHTSPKTSPKASLIPLPQTPLRSPPLGNIPRSHTRRNNRRNRQSDRIPNLSQRVEYPSRQSLRPNREQRRDRQIGNRIQHW